LLSLWLSRVFFLHAPEWVPLTHEGNSYASRLLEFRDLLGAGYASPQWATHFRQGLGSPFFGYYQPGLFYLASLVPESVAPVRALGTAVVLLGWLGYTATLFLVRRWFGGLSGALAASLLLLSVYACTEIYVRGDLSEFAAMMLLPAALWALAAWIEEGRLSRLVLLAATAGALPVTHPGLGLLGYGLLGMLAAVLLPTQRPRAARALLALALGVGLAAFYWMPILLEWDLVAAERAFDGFYEYESHFVGPGELVGGYTRDTAVPLTLGPILPGLVAINAVVLVLRRRELSRAQAAAVSLGFAALAATVFLMTEASALLWARLPLLPLLQFPWRLLALVTVLAASLAGAMLPWRREGPRAAVLACLVGASLLSSRDWAASARDPELRNLRDVAAVEATNVAPDVMNEWMPRDALEVPEQRLAALPTATSGGSVEGFERSQGTLRAQVKAERSAAVVLPHYAFPVGWTATLAGAPIEIGTSPRGLMRFALPAGTNGELEVRFSITPMRKAGLWVSGLTLLGGGLLLLASRPGLSRPPARKGRPRSRPSSHTLREPRAPGDGARTGPR
jgi:hypothetical protein